MKPRVSKCDHGPYRQWVVYAWRSSVYFPTWADAVAFAIGEAQRYERGDSE